ncbi:unnamed protein product [Nippostrongylus brasiliensis]|uniref:DUF1758 domain-containing protein n=1 Tax=Nippostrongylus brasiliensis TaxID=27835 RepID=A0A0N4YW75_NIPBR|nr:unnamed protein product [Nippostrongylus brasiliensis]
MHQHQLIARREELVARLDDLRAAIAAVLQRRTEFLATSLDSDQSSHESYLQEHSIDDVVIEAESIAATVQAHLDEVNSLIQAPSATDTSQLMPQVPAHEEQPHEASVNTSPAHACSPQLVSNSSPQTEHRTSSMQRRHSPHSHDRHFSPYDYDTRHVHFREATYSTQHSSSSSSLMYVKTKAADSDLQRFEDVVLLLDSGAQRSFISNTTTKSLHLQTVNPVPRTFVTFGGNSVTELSGTVHVHLIDADGQFVALKLLNKDVITLAQIPPRLTKQDIDFIHAQGLQLPTIQEDLVTPNILIGMDHYWDILSSEPPVCLPSGMLVVVAAGCSNPHPLRASAQDRTAQWTADYETSKSSYRVAALSTVAR